MDILGLEGLVFGVEDVTLAASFCRDFGLTEVGACASSAVFETADGSSIEIRATDDSELPPAIEAGSTLRKIIYGVKDADVLNEIETEMVRDRPAVRENGRLVITDDLGLSLAFQISQKRPFEPILPAANIPGHFQRPVNQRIDFERDVRPISIAHVVLDCAEESKVRAFFVHRLGFRVSDSFKEAGAFLRTRNAQEHHSLFTVKRPKNGLNHIAFYVTDFHDVMLGGKAMMARGWKTRWGPGRHKLGSNYFWYIQSPLGGAFEYTCDVDHVDDDWIAGEFDFSPSMTNIWQASDFPAV